jgi:hypothetical protein
LLRSFVLRSEFITFAMRYATEQQIFKVKSFIRKKSYKKVHSEVQKLHELKLLKNWHNTDSVCEKKKDNLRGTC